MTPLALVRKRLEQQGCEPKGRGSQFSARCPAHTPSPGSKNLPLSVKEGQDGKILLRCHWQTPCHPEAIVAALGLTMGDLFPDEGRDTKPRLVDAPREIVATYDYTDEQGQVLYQAVRYEPKDFRARRPDGSGWAWSTEGVRRVPYRLSDVLSAVRYGRGVIVVEGEKDADRLAGLGLTATSNVFGAGKWREEYDPHFAGADVAVIPDNDTAGERHATDVARHLHPVASSVRIVELPGLPAAGDVSDWLDAGHTLDELERLISNTTPLGSPPEPTSDDPEPATAEERYTRLLTAKIEDERVRREARRIIDAEERPPATLPDFVTLTDRLKFPPPPIKWRIELWQPTDTRVLLAAQFKAGKTTLTGNLVRSLVDRDRFLGAYDVEPIDGKVAILDFEMPEQLFYEWLRDQGIRDTDRVLPLSLRGKAGAFDLFNDDLRAQWAAMLREHEVRYLVWDCVRPVVDALGLDENREVGPLLVRFDELLADAGIPDAGVIHHMGHANERSRGDSRLRDWPDVEWRLVRENPDDPASARFVSAYGRDVHVGESRLEFDDSTRRLRLVGGNRKTAAVDRAIPVVLEFIRDNPDSNATEIDDLSKETDHKRASIRAAREAVVRDGRVTVKPGKQRAQLHSINTQSASPPESAESPPAHSVSGSGKSASAPIESARRNTPTDVGQQHLSPPTFDGCTCSCHVGAFKHPYDLPCPCTAVA